MDRPLNIRAAIALLTAGATLAGCDPVDPSIFHVPSEAERAELARLQAQASAENRRVSIAFDPARQAIRSDAAAAALVTGYGAPVAYRPLSGSGAESEAYRLIARPDCIRVRAMGVRGVRGDELVTPGTALAAAAPCMLVTREEPVFPAIEVRRSTESAGAQSAIKRHILTIVEPGGDRHRLVAYGFRNDQPASIAADLARALGLRPVALAEARALPGGELDAVLAHAGQGRADRQRSAIEAVLAGANGGEPDLALLRRDPAIVAPYTEQIVAAFERTAPGPAHGADGERLRRIADLVSALPTPELRRHGPRILAALERRENLVDFASAELVARLGDLGAPALPLLGKMLRDLRAADRVPGHEYLVAACRIGPPAAATLGPGLLEVWAQANAPELIRKRRRQALPFQPMTRSRERAAHLTSAEAALYVALLRLGLRDEAEARADHAQRARFSERGRTIGPQSAPEICTSASVL